MDKGEVETLIELVGSKVVTRRPVNASLSASEEDAVDESAPYDSDYILDPGPSDEDDIYQTPVALTPANWKKNKARVLADDTEVESCVSDSEIEVVEMVQKKRQQAPSSATDKVRSH